MIEKLGLGSGMSVADRIAGYQTFNVSLQLGGAFGALPLRSNALSRENLILFESTRVLAESTMVADFDFSESTQGFTGGFVDLPSNFDPSLYQLVADHRAVPVGLGSGKALYLSGANRSDDLWMFWKKKLTGLKPDTAYEVVLDLKMASNVTAGLVGIGGAPGESVFVKAGASTVEPVTVPDSEGWLRWNIDKGNQSTGGEAANVLGNIAKDGDSTENFVHISRTNRQAKLVATSETDGSLWIFFGTDSGFEGTTSVYFTRATAVLAPLPPVNLSTVAGDFLGNFESPSTLGQAALKIGKGGAFTGMVVTTVGRTTIRGRFSTSGAASVAVGLPLGSLELLLKTRGLEDGRWDAADEVYLKAILQSGGEEIPFELRPAPRKGGREAPLVGKTINTMLESHNESGKEFGLGFAGVRPGKDGVFRFAGALADGTKLTASARVVEDGLTDWKLPVAIPLSSVKGLLHGVAAIASSPAAEGFHLESEERWTWMRPVNPRAKSFQQGFEEKLTARGREWNWIKGTSALGGNSANFTIELSFGDTSKAFIPAPRLDGIQGALGPRNKPMWVENPPKAFAMTITPATGLLSGRMPGTLNGKATMLSYQGMLFPSDMPLESGGSTRGAGFVATAVGVVGEVLISSQ